MGLKWLITGGCGFIGRNLVKNLLDESGHNIRILDNLSVGTESDLAMVCDFSKHESIGSASKLTEHGVDLIVGDILDADLVEKTVTGIDIIVHLAANTGVAPSVENPRRDCEINILGTLNILEAARKEKVSRVIFASSGAPAGEVEPPIHEELAPHPVSPYGASKLAGEGYCSAYYRTFGLETVALRFGNVYGPYSGHKDSVVAKFIRQAMAGETLEIYGDGSQTRDFIYVDDLIQAIRRSSEVAGIGGEIFQIATNRETTLTELTDTLITTLKESGIIDVKVSNSSPRQGDVKRNFADTSKASKRLNWQASTSLEEGLRKTLIFVNKIGG